MEGKHRNKEKRASVGVLFEEVASLIVENFVATQQNDGENTLIMRLPNGQQFKISVEEMQ